VADPVRCSFCGKSEKDVRKLIAGPAVYICDECIDACNDILAEEARAEPEAAPKPLLGDWRREGFGVSCTLCGAVVHLKDALHFEGRVFLCPACVSAIAEAAKDEDN
jgi:hypothetical protein